MKLFILLVVVGFAAIAAGQEKYSKEKWEQLTKMRQGCIESSHVDEKILKKAQGEGIFDNNDQLIDFFICFFKGQNFFNEAGEYQPEAIKAKLINRFEPDVADEFIKTCTKVRFPDFRETVLKFAKCYHDEMVKEKN